MKLLMESFLFLRGSVLIVLFLLISICHPQTKDTDSISDSVNIQKAREIIESLDKQFSKDFYNGDSVAL